jgi:hypothetical protein
MADPADQILLYARARAANGKKVDRGECWDLGVRALEAANAKRPPQDFGGDLYVWGDKIALSDVQPGDILQIEQLQLSCSTDNGDYSGSVSHHTAIVEKVDGVWFTLLHQNFNGKRYPTRDQLPIGGECIKSGAVTAYRPLAKVKK